LLDSLLQETEMCSVGSLGSSGSLMDDSREDRNSEVTTPDKLSSGSLSSMEDIQPLSASREPF